MSELRDARFARALASAPDAHMRPAAAMRQAIQQAGRQAAAPAAPAAPWWKRLLFPAPSQRMPWNAAFATLLLAGMVTLLWHDREIPGAVSDTPIVERPAPAQMQSAPAAPVEAAPAAPAAPAAAAQPKPRATAAAPARKAAEAPRERVEAPVPLAKAEHDKETRQADMASASGNVAGESSSGAARLTPAPAPAPAAAPPAAPAMRAAAPAAQKSFAAPAWTLARIAIDGRSVEVAREQSGRLPALLAITAAARSNEPLMELPGASVQLLDATG
ncbi:MAG: hypothetical protein ABI907_14570, partial [Ramlibacter sp.]